MKKQILFFVVILITTLTSFSQEIKKVLFIGNSYTFYNNLPELVNNIAQSLGDSLYFDSSTPGGFTFQQHSSHTETINKINSENWDYVVLQEQSQLPSFPPSQVESESIPYAQILNNLIQENDSCTQTMFFMTWGRKNGDQYNCANYPPVCTYAGMQQRLRESYLLMGQLFDAEVAPVGATWQQVRINNMDIELYNSDESHPSISGSYLAACVFYSSIFHKSPVSNYYPIGVMDMDALYLQEMANEIVFDSLANWDIDTTNVYCSFDYNSNSDPEIQFSNQSENADNYTWNFGDNSFSNEENPTHIFPGPGTYEVVLVAERDCRTDTSIIIIDIFLSTDEFEDISNEIAIVPNPSSGKINLHSDNTAIKYEILDINGKVQQLEKIRSNNQLINTSELSSGIYIMRVIYKSGVSEKKFQVL